MRDDLQQPLAEWQELGSAPIRQESEEADADEATRQHVQHEPTQELLATDRHFSLLTSVSVVLPAYGGSSICWKDYAHGSKQRKMAISGQEFLRRFMLHVLPRGFVRIRFFGFLANRRRTQLLPLCQRLLEVISHPSLPALQAGETKLPASWLCPHCGGAMVLIEKFTAHEIRWKSAEASHFLDSS